MTAEIYYDPHVGREAVAVAWSPAGPFHTLSRDGSVEHGFVPHRFLTLLHGDAVEELQEKVDDLHEEANARHDDHVEELRIERASADEEALTKVLEAIETVLDLGEVRALLNPALAHARDALRDELVHQFTEALS